MPQIKTFYKGESIHCLISSYTNPNVFIPVRGIIKDVKWDSVNPLYRIKIVKFYENITFLKKHLFEMNFYHDFDKRTRPFRLKREDFSTVVEVEKRLSEQDEDRFYIVVDGVMAVKTKADLQSLFNKVQYFIIARNFKQIKEFSTRSFYRGEFKFDGEGEFKVRLSNFLRDKYPSDDLDSFLKSI
jgi:hypothetical protein